MPQEGQFYSREEIERLLVYAPASLDTGRLSALIVWHDLSGGEEERVVPQIEAWERFEEWKRANAPKEDALARKMLSERPDEYRREIERDEEALLEALQCAREQYEAAASQFDRTIDQYPTTPEAEAELAEIAKAHPDWVRFIQPAKDDPPVAPEDAARWGAYFQRRAEGIPEVPGEVEDFVVRWMELATDATAHQNCERARLALCAQQEFMLNCEFALQKAQMRLTTFDRLRKQMYEAYDPTAREDDIGFEAAENDEPLPKHQGSGWLWSRKWFKEQYRKDQQSFTKLSADRVAEILIARFIECRVSKGEGEEAPSRDTVKRYLNMR